MLREFFKNHKGDIPPFIDKIEDYDNLHIIRLKGPIDMFTIPDVDNLIARAIERQGILDKNIILDFKSVTHIDSATIAALLRVLHEIKHEHHKLIIINISHGLKDMLDIAKLDSVFSISESEEKAREELEAKNT